MATEMMPVPKKHRGRHGRSYVPDASDYSAAATLLAERIAGATVSEASPAWHSQLMASLRAAAASLALEPAHRGKATSNKAKAAFLVALAAGVDVHSAALLAGVNPRTVYDIKRADPAFRAAWDDALEQSLGPIDHRLAWIALNGDAGNMATVRAAEVLARRRSQVERRDVRVQMQNRGEDGQVRTITVRMGTPLPD